MSTGNASPLNEEVDNLTSPEPPSPIRCRTRGGRFRSSRGGCGGRAGRGGRDVRARGGGYRRGTAALTSARSVGLCIVLNYHTKKHLARNYCPILPSSTEEGTTESESE